ncbi:hypothetical protein PR048_010171 [Dryococelus australis]|uniref:Uncharacterized protein n=1 Tax=Dryococelus australis TaxID=614101 RepID=A0ABQ9I2D3_9NEOP|nr:hypothetical protein PR048_010171 [Dryococelus australis]
MTRHGLARVDQLLHSTCPRLGHQQQATRLFCRIHQTRAFVFMVVWSLASVFLKTGTDPTFRNVTTASPSKLCVFFCADFIVSSGFELTYLSLNPALHSRRDYTRIAQHESVGGALVSPRFASARLGFVSVFFLPETKASRQVSCRGENALSTFVTFHANADGLRVLLCFSCALNNVYDASLRISAIKNFSIEELKEKKDSLLATYRMHDIVEHVFRQEIPDIECMCSGMETLTIGRHQIQVFSQILKVRVRRLLHQENMRQCHDQVRPNNQLSTSYTQKKVSTGEKNQLDNHLLKLFTLDFQPLSIVEDKRFFNFVKVLNHTYTLPSRKMITSALLSA